MRLWDHVVWEWKLWRMRQQTPCEIKRLQNKYAKAKRQHRKRAHIARKMAEIRNRGLAR